MILFRIYIYEIFSWLFLALIIFVTWSNWIYFFFGSTTSNSSFGAFELDGLSFSLFSPSSNSITRLFVVGSSLLVIISVLDSSRETTRLFVFGDALFASTAYTIGPVIVSSNINIEKTSAKNLFDFSVIYITLINITVIVHQMNITMEKRENFNIPRDFCLKLNFKIYIIFSQLSQFRHKK